AEKERAPAGLIPEKLIRSPQLFGSSRPRGAIKKCLVARRSLRDSLKRSPATQIRGASDEQAAEDRFPACGVGGWAKPVSGNGTDPAGARRDCARGQRRGGRRGTRRRGGALGPRGHRRQSRSRQERGSRGSELRTGHGRVTR